MCCVFCGHVRFSFKEKDKGAIEKARQIYQRARITAIECLVIDTVKRAQASGSQVWKVQLRDDIMSIQNDMRGKSIADDDLHPLIKERAEAAIVMA